jgi:hypothetical protein
MKLKNCDNAAPTILDSQTVLVEKLPSTMSVEENFKVSDGIECPINAYRISKVVNIRTGLNEENINDFAEINQFG